MAKLGELGKVITGNTPKTSDKNNYQHKDIKFIKPSDILDNEVTELSQAEAYISEYARGKARIVPAGSILVTCIGIIGKVGIAVDECAFNQQINAVIPDNTKCLGRYLAYAISNEKSKLQDKSNAAVVPIINKTQFSDLEINLPSLERQHYIVNVLDKITGIITGRKQQLEQLDELVKSRFIEMFDSVEELCEVGYYIKSLIAGKSLAGEAECENKVLKTGAASFDYFDVSQVKNLPLDYEPKSEHLVSVGDIIISRMNTAELTGAAAYVWDVPRNIYVPDRLWKAVLTESSNPIFVWQMLIQPSTKEQIQRECSGTSGSMKNISKAGLLGIKVKKVPLDLQNQFADFVTQVDKSKLAVQKSLEQLEILKKALMQEYFG